MRRLSLALLPLCLSLSACAPEGRDANTSPAVAPTAVPAPAADTAAPPQPDEHAHHHDSATVAQLERPSGGGNWPTDAALRQGMQTIHVALAAALPAYEKGAFSATEATALASTVTSQVQFLLANCKLEPDADAQLHIVIGQMMSAAEAMVADAASADGVPKLHESMQLYGDYFDHPGLHEHNGAPDHAHAEPAATTTPAGVAPEADKPAQ